MITASVLIKYLQTLPDDTRIVLSSDAEGNNFSFMESSSELGVFDSKRREFYGEDESEVANTDGFVKAVLFYPEES